MAQHIVFYTCKLGDLSHAKPDKDYSDGTDALIKHFQQYNKSEIDLYKYIDKLVFSRGEKKEGAS
jgi:hypothetical protein